MVDARLERRRRPRYTIEAAARVLHRASGRDFPCRCLDISANGARLRVPSTMPVRPGHTVRLSGVDRFTEKVSDLAEGDQAATVVRVDRESLLSVGNLTIAVEFSAGHGGDDVGQ